MAKATKVKGRKRSMPISLSSTDTYTAAEYLTGVLGSKTLANVIAQPPSFLFIVCLLLVSILLPFLGLYVERSSRIPDLDTMMAWKTFTGNLRKESLCLSHLANTTHTTFPDFSTELPNCTFKKFTTLSAGIEIRFSKIDLFSNNEFWYANFSGSDLTVSNISITDDKNDSGLQQCVSVQLLVPFPSESCSDNICKACLWIRVPEEAKHLDILHNGNLPDLSCPAHDANRSTTYRELYLKEKTSCNVVGHVKEEYRQHGIVLVYLSKGEQTTSGRRLYICAGLALLAAVLFGFLSSLMDKPRDRRPGNE